MGAAQPGSTVWGEEREGGAQQGRLEPIAARRVRGGAGSNLFGDLCSGTIWAVRKVGTNPEVRVLLNSEVMPVALTRDHRGEILVVDAPGALWRLRLPSDLGGGWRPTDEVSTEMAMAARRAGFSRGLDLADQERRRNQYILESPRWRLTEPLARVYRLLGRPLH